MKSLKAYTSYFQQPKGWRNMRDKITNSKAFVTKKRKVDFKTFSRQKTDIYIILRILLLIKN